MYNECDVLLLADVDNFRDERQQKDFFKLMNNSVYGKTMENLRKRRDIKFVISKQRGEKLAAQPNFKHCTIFDENLVGIEMGKTKIEYNKPIYLAHAFLI